MPFYTVTLEVSIPVEADNTTAAMFAVAHVGAPYNAIVRRVSRQDADGWRTVFDSDRDAPPA